MTQHISTNWLIYIITGDMEEEHDLDERGGDNLGLGVQDGLTDDHDD